MITATLPNGTVLLNIPGVDEEGVFTGKLPTGVGIVYLRPGSWKGKVINIYNDKGEVVNECPDLDHCGEICVTITQDGSMSYANGKYIRGDNCFYTPSPWMSKNVEFWSYVNADKTIRYGVTPETEVTPAPTPTPKGTEIVSYTAAGVKQWIATTTLKETVTYIVLALVLYGILTGKVDASALLSLP